MSGYDAFSLFFFLLEMDSYFLLLYVLLGLLRDPMVNFFF